MWRIIVPNMSSAVLNACLLSVAVVLGEFTIANLLNFENLQVAISLIGRANAGVSIAVAVASLMFVFVLLLVLSFILRAGGRRRAAVGVAMTAVAARPVTASSAARSGVEVRLEDLRRQYGSVTALDGLNITIAPGELVALLGPSGCGKTTGSPARRRPGGRRRRPSCSSAART